MSQIVYILQGLPGSGKSTWTEKMKLPVVSRDQARIDLGFCKEGEKYKGTKEEENKVTKYVDDLYSKYLKLGKSFVVDDTNLKKIYRDCFIEKIRKEGRSGVKVVGVIFTTPLLLCIQRRKGEIPENIIRSMAAKMEPIKEDEVDELVYV